MIELSVAVVASSPLQAWILRWQKDIVARHGVLRRTVEPSRTAAANRLATDNALAGSPRRYRKSETHLLIGLLALRARSASAAGARGVGGERSDA
jgi:hypothetical protein